MKLVIDMMGGDHGTKTTIEAVKQFVQLHKDCEIFAVGNEEEIQELNGLPLVHIVPSKTVLPMDADPMSAMKTLDSSLMVGIQAFLDNGCDGLISAGSTGALLTASIFKIKRLQGIKRPCLITSFPTGIDNKKFVACDLGANASDTKEELEQFAMMGSLYYSILYNEEHPKVYLLNNGTEEEKGNPLTKETYQLLKVNPHINFKGNLEGRDAMKGEADVIVCDGFTGNIFLKTLEGTAKAMGSMMKDAFKMNLSTKIGYLFAKKGIKAMIKKMDYKNVGGALLLGVNGIVIKSHGSSEAKSFLASMESAYNLAKQDLIGKIKVRLDSNE